MSEKTPPVSPEHLENLLRSCSGATISRFLGKTIEILKPGHARVTLPFHPELTQNSDFVHGAVLFEAADTAGFVAANSIEETYSVLTVDYYIRLLRPVQREGIYADAQVLHHGRTLITVRSDVYNESGKLVATGQGTYIVSQILLSQVPGYQPE